MHSGVFFSPVPSHLFTRGNSDVIHFTLGDNGGWKKATGRPAGGPVGGPGEERGIVGEWGGGECGVA